MCRHGSRMTTFQGQTGIPLEQGMENALPRQNPRLFLCHHRYPDVVLDTPLFKTMVSNLPASPHDGLLSDLGGDNIATEQSFSEMRQQYAVWKNGLDGLTHVGFEHYRRVLFIDPLTDKELLARAPNIFAHRRASVLQANASTRVMNETDFDSYLSLRKSLTASDLDSLQRYLCSFDLVVPRPLCQEPLAQQWHRHHPAGVWSAMEEALASRNVHYHHRLATFYAYNIYFMRADLFAEYMTFAWSILSDVQSRTDIRTPRLWGFLTERLFSIFVFNKRLQNPMLKILEAPVAFRHTPTAVSPGGQP